MRRRKHAGDPLDISAADWNWLLDAADRLNGGKGNRRDNSLTIRQHNCDILGKNVSGSDLAQFSIVGLSGNVDPTPAELLIEFKQQNNILEITEPTVPDHVGKWGILQEPLTNGSIGRVRVAGIGIAKVQGTAPDETDFGMNPFPFFADIEDAVSDYLVPKHRGAAQVLYRHAGTSWAIVRIGNVWRPHAIRGTIEDGNEFEQETAADPHTLGTIIGIDTQWVGDSTVEIDNPMKIKLWQGCLATCHYNVTAQRWEVIAATSDKVVHGIKREDCEFKKLDGADGWTYWDAGYAAAWLTDIYLDGCDLYYSTDCEEENLAASFDYVTSVTATATVLYYTKCSGNYLIANIGPCPVEAPCGTTTYEVQDIDNVLTWVLVADTCTGGCEDVGPPATTPIVVGQSETLACEVI